MSRRFVKTALFRLEQEMWDSLALMAKERESTMGRLLRAIVAAEIGRWETPARLRERASQKKV